MKYLLYQITNLINNKIYIGQHTTANEDDGYMGSGVIINHAKKKYGVENFLFDILRYCKDNDELNYYEAKCVNEEFINRKDTYNLQVGGGYEKPSEETRRKMSKAQKGRKHSEESKRKIRKAKQNISEETKRKISDARKGKKPMLGKKHSKETKQKMSIARKGQKGHMLDKKHSKETKQKMSIARKGKKGHMLGKKQPLATCPHCGKVGGINNMFRWHFDNCKHKESC